MHCTSYIPVYHGKDLNVGSSGSSWPLFSSNAKYVEENGYDISSPTYNMVEQYLSPRDKEVLRQIIQNHDATFRHQVRELHRLYKKQRELMDEMRARKVFSQSVLSQTTSESIHSLSHAQSETSHATSQATSWLLGDHSHSKLSELTGATFQQPPKFIPSNYFQEISLERETFPAAEAYHHGDERNQFRDRNISKAPELTRDLSGFNLNNGKRHCFIDLNEPIQFESSLPSSSKCPMGTYTCHMEIMHNNPRLISDSLVPKDSGFLNCDVSSDGINSSVAIDLNSMPIGCFSETETNFENMRTIKKGSTEILDKCVEDHPFVDTMIDYNKLLKTETDIDLNADVVLDEPSPLPSSSTVWIKSEGDGDLEGPVSPENEECSPPRGKPEDIKLEQGKKEASVELDTIAAQTLVTISSSGAHGCLSWFAEIVVATGDDLDLTRVVEKEKEIGTLSVRSQKGHARGTRRRKDDSRAEVLLPHSKNGWEIEGFLQTGSSRRKTGKKACAKPRKYSKLSSERVKKPMRSILKQAASWSKHGVLRSWGMIKKREGGLRRKASKFLVIS